LVEKGADPFYVSTMIFERNKPNVIQLLTKTLSTLELYHDSKIASLVVKRDFIEKTGTDEEDTEGFVNYAVAFIMIQKPDRKTWRVSLRGKGKVPVRDIAKEFDGGGHRDAAGCRVIGEEGEVKRKIVETAIKYMNQYETEKALV